MRTRTFVGLISTVALIASGCVNLLRLDVNSAGVSANDTTSGWDLSADGKYAVFVSAASNLGNNPTGVAQVWRRNTQSGVTELVSRSAGCSEPCAGGDAQSARPVISADGRYVAFESAATNLLPGGDPNGLDDVYRTDMHTGVVEGVSYSNGHSRGPSISNDGNRIAFESASSLMVPGDTNGVVDIFVRTMTPPAYQRVSVGPNGAQGDSASVNAFISGDGLVVAFRSDAASLGGPAGSFYFHETGVTTHFFTNIGGSLTDIDDDGDRFAVIERGSTSICRPIGCFESATNTPEFLDRAGQSVMFLGGYIFGSVELLGLVDHQPRITADGKVGTFRTAGLLDGNGGVTQVDLFGESFPEAVFNPPAGHLISSGFDMSADGQVLSATFPDPGPGSDSHDARFAHAPEITSVTSDRPLVAGVTAQLSITGEHFGTSSDDVLGFRSQPNFLIDNIVRIDHQLATARLTVPANASAGTYPLIVDRVRWQLRGGGLCADCIVVTP